MNRVYRTNRIRDYRPFPPEAFDRSRRSVPHTMPNGRHESSLTDRVREETEEVGLTLLPAARYRSVLVPVDGELFGEHALPLALGIARRAGAELRVVHVHCPMQSTFSRETVPYRTGLDVLLRDRQQAYLDGLFRRVRKVSSVPVTSMLLEGRDITRSLCDAARAGTDLVVMATHGRGPLGRFWSGSVADALLRTLEVPLLLVRGYNAPADLTGDPPLRRMLVPLDGSPFAERILEPAVELGSLQDADMTLLRVVRPVTDYSAGYPGVSLHPSVNGRQESEAWNYVRRVAERLGGEALRVDPRLIVDGEPTHAAILRYARSHDADLIALATRGRRGLTGLLRGSVADRVIRGASMPVLVYGAGAAQEGE